MHLRVGRTPDSCANEGPALLRRRSRTQPRDGVDRDASLAGSLTRLFDPYAYFCIENKRRRRGSRSRARNIIRFSTRRECARQKERARGLDSRRLHRSKKILSESVGHRRECAPAISSRSSLSDSRLSTTFSFFLLSCALRVSTSST